MSELATACRRFAPLPALTAVVSALSLIGLLLIVGGISLPLETTSTG